jgi:hypothetical protein
MAWQLSAVLLCGSVDLATKCGRLLSRETRPIFEEDVPDQDRLMFQAISPLEYAGATALSEAKLLVEWVDCEGLSIKDLVPLLSLPGISLLLAYELPDDPLSWDEDVSDGWFWMLENGSLIKVSKRRALEKCSKELVDRLVA